MGSRALRGRFAMIFGTDVGIPLSPPSLALVSQMLEQFVYVPGHTREDIPSGISARCLWVLDRGYPYFLERRACELRRISLPKLSKKSDQRLDEGLRSPRSGANGAYFAASCQRFLRSRHHRATF